MTLVRDTSVLEKMLPPKNWIWRSVIVFISLPFHFLAGTPIALVGLVYAILSRRKFKKGDYEGAEQDARIAGIWVTVIFWALVTYYTLIFIYSVVTNLHLLSE